MRTKNKTEEQERVLLSLLSPTAFAICLFEYLQINSVPITLFFFIFVAMYYYSIERYIEHKGSSKILPLIYFKNLKNKYNEKEYNYSSVNNILINY